MKEDLRQRLASPVTITDLTALAFWIGWLLILGVAIVFHMRSSQVFGFPYWFADSEGYLAPVFEHSWLPFSELRTIGYPAFLAIALGLAGHPIGVLFGQNLLWLISTVALSLTVLVRLQSRTLSLLVLIYLCYIQKNFAFELFVLSEHLSRTLICLALSVLILGFARPSRLQMIILALLTFLGIVVKPTAVILVPAIAVWLLAARLVKEELAIKNVLKLFLLYLVPVALLVGGYMSIYRARYGYYGLSAMTGLALYAHVGHLTNLDSKLYPEVISELNKILPIYHRNYAGEEFEMGDWFAYGSIKREREYLDFGNVSPRSIVHEYASRLPGPESTFRKEERILRDLAIDGIKAHPGKYLRHVGRSLRRLLVDGFTAKYRNPFVTVNSHQQSVVDFRRTLVKLGQPEPQVRGLLYQPEEEEQLTAQTIAGLGRLAMRVVTETAILVTKWPFWLIVVLLGPIVSVSGRLRQYRLELGLLCVLVVLVAAHAMLHACLLANVVSRYMSTVQDAFVLTLLLVLRIEIGCLWRLRWRAVRWP
jgi:hypothetical protein